MPVANEVLKGFPTENVLVLVMTVSGRGVDPRCVSFLAFFSLCCVTVPKVFGTQQGFQNHLKRIKDCRTPMF